MLCVWYKRVKALVIFFFCFLSFRLLCIWLTKRLKPAKKGLWRPSSILWRSHAMPLWLASSSWAAHRDRDKDSWSTVGWQTCPTKEVRENAAVRALLCPRVYSHVHFYLWSHRKGDKHGHWIRMHSCQYSVPHRQVWMGADKVRLHWPHHFTAQ